MRLPALFDKTVTQETLKQRRWGLLRLERTRLLTRISFDLQQRAAMWGFTNPCVRPCTYTSMGLHSINEDDGSQGGIWGLRFDALLEIFKGKLI